MLRSESSLERDLRLLKPYEQKDIINMEQGLIFMSLHGSHAYGLARPDSDLDIRAIYVGSPGELYGFNRREQYDKFTEIDMHVYELRKFVRLASECNPNMIELLFLGKDVILYQNPLWEQLYRNRHLFLSKRAADKFCGYAQAQLKRIKGHKKWITNPQSENPPSQEDFTRRVYQEVGFEPGRGINPSARSSVEIYDKDAYKGAHKKWKQYWHWKKNRNTERAELEEKFGYDTKHAMHLLRLLRMGKEILETKDLIVNRRGIDDQDLLAVRKGTYPYLEVLKAADILMREIEELREESDLPKKPDLEYIEEILMNTYNLSWNFFSSREINASLGKLIATMLQSFESGSLEK